MMTCAVCLQFACTWLRTVLQTHSDVFVQCLLPDPPSYAKVGGNWDKMSKRNEQLKEGLSKILALIPYDLISYETWEKIMPMWFEVISMQISESDLAELKVLLCKIFEVNLCSLSFPPQEIYHFIEVRLTCQDYQEQAMAVRWLQLLTDIDILIPLDVLLNLLKCTAENVPTLLQTKAGFFKASKEASVERDTPDDEMFTMSPQSSDEIPLYQQSILGPIEETNVTLFAIMLDVLLRQMELWDVPKNQGVESGLMQSVLILLTVMMKAPWSGIHVCENPDFDDFADCMYCRVATVFCQLLVETVQDICPRWYSKTEVSTTYSETKVINQGKAGRKSFESVGSLVTGIAPKDSSKSSTSVVLEVLTSSADGGKGPFGKTNGALKTAVIHEESPPIEFVGILPTEEPEIGIAETVTLTETDMELATCKVVTTTLIDEQENEEEADKQPSPTLTNNFWPTSVGNFRFCLEESHGQLQLLYHLMNKIENFRNPDVIYYKLCAVKYLCLHGKSLSKINSDERGFLIWAQENILIPKFWTLLQTQYSQIAEVCTPLILHCLNLPSGADTYWKLIDEDFSSSDPMVRFAAGTSCFISFTVSLL
ncbi:unnamed protein product [Soboliphyme baturini]|uniref:Protein unc-79 homolog n=1 Tax=Soboliphyme baturini TaxID=241478 RepID=A0A183J562_9BILA|nr:unnamed protein product [Soboliphyme baturini]